MLTIMIIKRLDSVNRHYEYKEKKDADRYTLQTARVQHKNLIKFTVNGSTAYYHQQNRS